MKKLIIVFAALLIYSMVQAQDSTPIRIIQELQSTVNIYLDYYRLTDERLELIPHINNSSISKFSGSFLSDELFAHKELSLLSGDTKVAFEGIPFSINVKEGDIITMTFEFDNAEDINSVKSTKKNPYTKRVKILDLNDYLVACADSLYDVCSGVYYDKNGIRHQDVYDYYSPDYNSIALKQMVNGVYYPIIKARYNNIDIKDINPNYSIVVSRYGKLESISFDVDENATFNLTDPDGLLKYNLLRYVRVTATDVYGRDIPILNSLVSQWQVDKETGIARFTPILYPFSCTIEGMDDSYETDATNKSASTEEDDDAPNAGTTLDNCMTLEAVNPNMLLLDLNKGGTVTDIATINANATAQDVWYDMFGRKYTTKPTAAGLYIHNGKKEVVK